MKQLLINFAAGAGLALAVFFAIDQLRKAHKANQMPHLTNDAMLLSGSIIAILAAGLAVYAFTGTLVPLYIFSALASIIFGIAYAVRLKRDKEANARWETLLAEEELQAGETADRDPANAAAWARLAQLRERRGNLRGALELFSIACKLEPTQLNLDRLASLRERVNALPPEPWKDNK
jgi:tetratricopeptide (TPR) repeat protein